MLLCFVTLKTWLRSKMDEERLTGSALLNIHSGNDVGVQVVVDDGSRVKKSKKKRKKD